MRVIDLLNKIANGEEVPKKIGYDNKIFEFDELERQYTFHNLDYSVNVDLGLSIEGLRYSTLNDEVEIIEEDKEIEYEEIKECFAGVELEYNEFALEYKINQLIRNQKTIIKELTELKKDR